MAEPTAHTEAPGEGHGGFPPFQSQHFPSQLVWLVDRFVLLYALMSRIALPRIGGDFRRAQKRIADDSPRRSISRGSPRGGGRRL